MPQTIQINSGKRKLHQQALFPIVGIGNCAGGPDAVSGLLSHLPPDTGMAFIYMQHANPIHKTGLPGILSKQTKMKVLAAKNEQVLKPNHIYVLPANKEMHLEDGKLKLIQPQDGNMPIDLFFNSIAGIKKEKAIGILLPGNVNDGTTGLKAIKLADGITFVQDILSPADIAEELERIGKHFMSADGDGGTHSIKKIKSGREELQRLNEELEKLKEELQTRNSQVAEQQEYSQAIISTMRESLLILDKDLRIKSANESFYQKFNLTQKEIEGILVYDMNNKQWDIPKLHELLDGIIPQQVRFRGFEVIHTFPEIGEKIMLINAQRLHLKTHHEELILLTIEDITQQEKVIALLGQKKFLQQIADNAPVMIWMDGPDKRFTFLNSTWQEYTGRDMPEAIEKGWQGLIHPDDVAEVMRLYTEAFDNRQPFRLEYRVMRCDGQYRWIMNTGRPILNYDEFAGYIGTCLEIHDHRLLNQELEERVKKRTADLRNANISLERSNGELQQFAYVASHDLQEPLRKIITFSNNLMDHHQEAMTAEAKKYIEKIVASSKRMSRLIDDVLNFSRVTHTGSDFIKTDLAGIVKEVISDFELQLQQRKITINIGALPVIEAVPLQMRQLFHNLVSNAIKFSKNVNPWIDISAQRLKDEDIQKYRLNKKSYIGIIVKDNGIGFDQEFAEQIFIIFQRLHGKSEYSGTGIGLALCKKIVESHNGIIFASSIKNEGASFHVIIPENHSH